MDPFLLGETLVGGDATTTYTGFWMPAGGNDGVAGIEVFYLSSAADAAVRMETKSSDEADSAVSGNIGMQTITSTSPGITKFDVSDAQDLVRYVITVESGVCMHFQFSQPLWAPN